MAVPAHESVEPIGASESAKVEVEMARNKDRSMNVPYETAKIWEECCDSPPGSKGHFDKMRICLHEEGVRRKLRKEMEELKKMEEGRVPRP
jgi:hypothetical protein